MGPDRLLLVLRSFADRLASPGMAVLRFWRRRQKRVGWEAKWSRDDFDPRWGGRGVAPEIESAMADGWLPAKGTMLDVGCGLAEISAWFAVRGYRCVAMDISRAAVTRAASMHRDSSSCIEFVAGDICSTRPPGGSFDVIVDRGCLHQLRHDELPNYVASISAVASDRAKMLLFVKAFRGGIALDDPDERRRKIRWIQRAFSDEFCITNVTTTFLDRFHGTDEHRRMPGLVFWMVRSTARNESYKG